MLENFDLTGSFRESAGTTSSNRDRKNGFVPGVIYDSVGSTGVKNRLIKVDAKTFEKQYFAGRIFNKLVNLSIDGKNFKLFVKDVSVHPVTELPLHIDFINASDDRDLKLRVPVEFINTNKCVGLKRGGFFNVLTPYIEVIGKKSRIPTSIQIDAEPLSIGATIKSPAIKLPEGVSFAKKKDFVVATMLGSRKGMSEAVAETAKATKKK